MAKIKALEKIAGGVIEDTYAFGPAGMGAARREQILNEIADARTDKRHKGSNPKGHALREGLGTFTSLAASRLGGRVLGLALAKLTGNENAKLIGDLAGVGTYAAGTAIGSLAAAVKRRRTKEEQLEHDKGSTWMDLLIPGVGAYNSFKRMGRAFDENDERVEERVKDIIRRKGYEKKKGEKSYEEGSRKAAEATWADLRPIRETSGKMDKQGGILDDIAAGYAQLSPGARMAVNAAGAGAIGAGIGGLAGKKGKKGLAALIGALTGGATGAASSSFLNAPGWLQRMAIKGTKGLMTGRPEDDDEAGKKLIRWLASNAKEEARDYLNHAADDIGKPMKIHLPWWEKNEFVEGPKTRFDIDSLINAIDSEKKDPKY